MNPVELHQEIRPLSFGIELQRPPQGDPRLVIVHPMEGTVWVYDLQDDLYEALKSQFNSGLTIAPAGSVAA